MKPYFETALGKLYNCDCLEFMKEMEDKSVDLVLADPPYGIGEDKRKSDKSGRREYNDDWDYRPTNSIFIEILRTSVNSIIWGGNYFSSTLPDSRGWLIWDKVQKFTGADCELAWTSFDSSTKSFRKSRVEVHSKMNKKHPTQKPLELMVWCIKFADKQTRPTLVLDPFLGSGTTAVACEKLGRKWIGIEISEKYCEIAAKRISLEASQGKMFL